MSANNEDDFMSFLNEDAFKSEDDRPNAAVQENERPANESVVVTSTSGPTETEEQTALRQETGKSKQTQDQHEKEPLSKQEKPSKPLGQLLNEAHLLYAETRHAQAQQLTAADDHQLQVYFKNLSNDSRFGSAEHEIEYALVKRMRHFRRNVAKEYSPYAQIDLEELLNPGDRLESLIMKSGKSHGLNNLHLEKLIRNLAEFIENENAVVKRLQRLASVIQGDDFHWISSGVDFNDSEQYDQREIQECRQYLQQYLNNDLVVIEKLQDIRDKLTFIHARKREFLKSLRERFSA